MYGCTLIPKGATVKGTTRAEQYRRVEERIDCIKEIFSEFGYGLSKVKILSELADRGYSINKTTLDSDLKRMDAYKGTVTKTKGLRALDDLIVEMTRIKDASMSDTVKKDCIMKLAVLHEKRQRMYDILDARRARQKISRKKLPTTISFGEVEVADSVAAVAEQED